ncbi:MAG: peptidase M16 [Coxiella sp. (in: Bacteria)]|nr:MAG: peptidase M16 [Coxiella sp. (in: g-proteobacteria)]
MYRVLNVIVSIALLLMSVASAAANVKIQHWQTTNGASVYFVKLTSLPIVDVRLVFAAGSAYDGKDWGLAAVTNNMIGQGTKTLSADQVADQFDRVGALFSGYLDRDMATVSLRSLTNKKYLRPALKTFNDVLGHAIFADKAFQRSIRLGQTSIKANMQTPDAVAGKTFFKTLYGDEPYGHPVNGTLASLQNMTLADVSNFYQHYYVAKNADIVLVGDLSASKAKSIAETLSQQLPEGAPAKRFAMMTADATGKTVHVEFPSKQTAIVLGQLGITRQNPHYYALVVGNYILGGLPMTSLLFDSVRNKRGLSYSVGSQFDPLRYKGPFAVQLKTRADKTAATIAVVKKTVDDFINDGPTTKQLKDAKNYINGSFPLGVTTNKSIAGVVTNIAFYKRPLNYLDTFLKNINAVTVNDVKNAMQSTLHPKDMILVTVGPKA